MLWVCHDILKRKGGLIRVRHHWGMKVKLKVEVLILVKDKLLGLRGVIRLLVRVWKREVRSRVRWTIGLMSLKCRMLNL
jgi:hypothetical protein